VDLGAYLHESDSDGKALQATHKHKCLIIYLLLLVAFLSVQFGHGSNIGVAVSLKGNSKAMNLALGSWVTVGVCVGLPVTPWACRTWGAYRVCVFCLVIDVLVILLMMWPGITLHQIYVVRFLVGFFEAPFLPYLQEWLARFGKHTWNVWNAILHAMVPVGECLGYIIAQELVEAGFSWQYAFAGQAAALSLCSVSCLMYGGRKYLDLSHEKPQVFVADDPVNNLNGSSTCNRQAEGGGYDASQTNSDFTTSHEDSNFHSNGDADFDSSVIDEEPPDREVEYPVTEKWAVFWATNASLAAQLGFLSGAKYVIRDYGEQRGFSVHTTIFMFSAIALVGPAIGGAIAMSGSVIRPDQWSQHKKTIFYIACTSSVASGIAVLLPYTSTAIFWPALFACFIAAGGVYPAAQGIINIALTSSRVIDASVYQVQCNNILFAMPIPYVIGKSLDLWGEDTSFRCVTLLQVLSACGFALALVAATCTEERSAWHRLQPHAKTNAKFETGSPMT